MEEETRQNLEGQHKKEQMEATEQKPNVSQAIDDIVHFIDTDGITEDDATAAFKVSLSFDTSLFQIGGRGRFLGDRFSRCPPV